MNILYICHRIPYPPNKGDKIRSFNEIKYLSKSHSIFLACLLDNENDLQYIPDLERYCETVDYELINPWWQKVKSLPSLLSDKPMSISYFYSKSLQTAVNRILSENIIDVVFVFSSPMAAYVMNHMEGTDKRSRLVMDFVDVDSDKWRLYSERSSFPYSFIYRREWKSLRQYERKVGEVFDVSLFVSDNELALYKSFAPHVKGISIPNGVDIDYFSEVPHFKKRRGAKCVLFTGAMDYFPNEDAVLYFSKEIWPEVRKRMPGSVFYVVGSNPSKRVKALTENNSGIAVTGYVADVRKYFSRADVFVAPLRIARGLQNKVLEAMSAGVPVVASPEAVQGLPAPNGCIAVAENRSTYIDFITDVLKNSAKREKQISSAKQFIDEHHNWQRNLDRLKAVI